MRLHLALSLLASAVATPTFAAPIDGSWKADVASASLSPKPDVYAVKAGSFTCLSCVPHYTVKTDGAFHPVTGFPYVDHVSAEIVDPHTIRQRYQLGGKTVIERERVVSPDGRTQIVHVADMTAPDGRVAKQDSHYVRVGAAPAGQHAAGGSWRATKIDNVSEQALVVNYATHGRDLTFKTPDGFTYTAALGGKPVTVTGQPASQTVAVRALPNGIVETSYDAGKLVGVRTLTVAPGGKTMTVVDKDLKRGTTSSWKMQKVG